MEKVKLGIIGVGNMGSGHIKNIQEGKCPDIEITAVADLKQSALDNLKEKLPNAKFFNDPIEMMDSKEIDAVIVATPHYDHPGLSIEAMKRGIHVMCEKPAGVYTKQVVEMNEVAKDCDVVFGMMFNQRTNPMYIKMRELIQSGKYGEIKRVNWIITTWYRTQQYYDSGDWRATWSGEGGGVLLNQCPHQLDLLQWICGMPSKVLAKLHYGKWHDIEVEDDVTAYLEYPNGATGVFITTTGDAYGSNRFEVQLDKAKIVAEGNNLTVLEYEVSSKEYTKTATEGFKPMPSNKLEIDLSTDKETGHVGVLNAFSDKILGKGELIAGGIEGINGLTISNAMHLSSFTDKEVELPLDEELYYNELMKRVATSRRKDPTTEQVAVNLDSTY